MSDKNESTAELVVTPKHGDADTVFDFRGSGYEPGQVLAIDFGDGASTSVTVSDDGHWHCNYKFAAGEHKVTTKYLGEAADADPNDTVTVKVS